MKIGNTITVIALVICAIMAVITGKVLIQQKDLIAANTVLTNRVIELSTRVTTLANERRGVVKTAVTNAKEIDAAYVQIHHLSETLHDTKLMLTSARKMITRYKEAEQKAVSSYITKRYTKVSHKMADEIAAQTIKVAKEENVPVSILVAIMDQESGFNPMAKSPSGARGLMQVMPFWVKEFKFIKNKRELHDVYKGIKAGAIVLRYGLDKTNGNIKKALAIYKGPKYVAYVKRVMQLAGEFEIHKETLMAPIKGILETFYVSKTPEMKVSLNGFGPAHFDSVGGYPPVQGFTNLGPYGGSGFTSAVG